MAIRQAFQVELYGLTAAQRTNGAAAVNSALDSEAVQEVTSRIVDPDRVVRRQALLFVEADFTTEAAGGRIFNTARTWASTRAETAANGVPSYVRLISVDDEARTRTERYADSANGWTATVVTTGLDARRT